MNSENAFSVQGKTILDNERYLPIIKLDTGGMAEVFLGAQFGEQNFERLVVIKRIHGNRMHNSLARKMFISEARVVANLDHPHIVKIYELSKIGNEVGIIMEYVDGESVAYIIDALRKIGASIPLPVVLAIIVQACEGIGYAHRVKSHDGEKLNLIHRDIDANNLMLDGRGYLKIIDFGIAKTSLDHDLTMTGQIKGKIDYLCPDVLNHKDYDSRVDIYSLGLVFFEMLTMQKPLLAPKGTPLWQLVELVQANTLPLVTSINESLPKELNGIVAKATEKDREKRYQTAEAFAMDIRQFAKQYCEIAPPNVVRAWFLGQFPKRLASRRDLERTVLSQARELYTDRLAKATTEHSDLDSLKKTDPDKILKIDDALKPVSDAGIAMWSKSQNKRLSVLPEDKRRGTNPYALLTLFFVFFVIGTLMIHQLFFAETPIWSARPTQEAAGTFEDNLFISSIPNDAQIYIDDKKIGTTGVSGKTTRIEPNEDHKIIIEKDNYLPYEIIVQGESFGQRRIEARLNPAPEEADQVMEFSEKETIDAQPPAKVRTWKPLAPKRTSAIKTKQLPKPDTKSPSAAAAGSTLAPVPAAPAPVPVNEGGTPTSVPTAADNNTPASTKNGAQTPTGVPKTQTASKKPEAAETGKNKNPVNTPPVIAPPAKSSTVTDAPKKTATPVKKENAKTDSN